MKSISKVFNWCASWNVFPLSDIFVISSYQLCIMALFVAWLIKWLIFLNSSVIWDINHQVFLITLRRLFTNRSLFVLLRQLRNTAQKVFTIATLILLSTAVIAFWYQTAARKIRITFDLAWKALICQFLKVVMWHQSFALVLLEPWNDNLFDLFVE